MWPFSLRSSPSLTQPNIARVLGGDGITSMGTGGARNSAFGLWPNPSNGEELWLCMPVMLGATKVAVVINDRTGKRVVAQKMTGQGADT